MGSISLWKFDPGKDDFTAIDTQSWQSANSLDEVSEHLPSGVYTTFRTYGKNKVISLSRHFERLSESAQLAGQPVEIDIEHLRKIIQKIVLQRSDADLRIRLTVDLEQAPGTVYITLEPLKTLSPELYVTGCKAKTYRLQRNNPKAKLTRHIAVARKIRAEYTKDIQEIITISSDGAILEGLSSNFFAVKDGMLFTAGEGILQGTVRNVVLELAAAEKIPVSFQSVQISDMPDVDEAFICSTSRAILPLVLLDEQVVADGHPGEMTNRLMVLYRRWVERHLEAL